MRQLLIASFFLTVFVTTSCGWHLCNKTAVPLQMKKMIFNSKDPSSPLSYAIYRQMRINGIELIKKDSLHQDIPSFSLLNSSLSTDVIPIFHDWSTTKGYQMILSVNAEVQIPGVNIFPISTKVCHTLFNNQQSPLAKDAEKQIIINEMYDKAAEQIIRKLPSISLTSKYVNTGN